MFHFDSRNDTPSFLLLPIEILRNGDEWFVFHLNHTILSSLLTAEAFLLWGALKLMTFFTPIAIARMCVLTYLNPRTPKSKRKRFVITNGISFDILKAALFVFVENVSRNFLIMSIRFSNIAQFGMKCGFSYENLISVKTLKSFASCGNIYHKTSDVDLPLESHNFSSRFNFFR